MPFNPEVRGWIKRGKEQGSKYLVVICDTFSYEDYPVFCATAEEAIARKDNPGEMQRVLEIINLSES